MDSEETRIYIAILITSLVLGSILLFFSVSIIKQQRRNLQLQRQQSAAEQLAMEKERSRIAADLHDEVGPYLTLVRLRLSELNSLTEEEAREKETIAGLLDQSLEKIREISFNLMPASLKHKGLISGLKELVSQLHRLHPLKIALVADDEIQVNEQKTIHLFRVVQEMLHNVIKHAEATEVLIVMAVTEGMLVIKLADNGKGFDVAEQKKNGSGYGLRSIQHRVESMGGRVFVKAEKGKGVSWVVEVDEDEEREKD